LTPLLLLSKSIDKSLAGADNNDEEYDKNSQDLHNF